MWSVDHSRSGYVASDLANPLTILPDHGVVGKWKPLYMLSDIGDTGRTLSAPSRGYRH